MFTTLWDVRTSDPSKLLFIAPATSSNVADDWNHRDPLEDTEYVPLDVDTAIDTPGPLLFPPFHISCSDSDATKGKRKAYMYM